MADYNSSLPTRTENPGDIIAKLCDATVPSQQVAVDANGNLSVGQSTASNLKAQAHLFDGAGNAITSQVNGAQRALDVGINVSGTQIDPRSIRALTNADVVTVEQGTSPWTVSGTLGLSLDLDYGTVGANTLRTASQIGNATGAASFGAGATSAQTLRVEANQGASATAANGWYVRPTDGTNNQSFTASGEVKASITQPLPAGTNNIGVVSSNTRDGSGNAITSGVQGSARALDVEIFANGSVISNSNPIPVSIASSVTGTEVLDYQTSAAVAAAASVNHDYTVTVAKTLKLQQISATGSGKIKVEVKIGGNTKLVKFNSTATPNVDHSFFSPQEVAAGTVIRITITNLDKAAQDLYSTLEGYEY